MNKRLMTLMVVPFLVMAMGAAMLCGCPSAYAAAPHQAVLQADPHCCCPDGAKQCDQKIKPFDSKIASSSDAEIQRIPRNDGIVAGSFLQMAVPLPARTGLKIKPVPSGNGTAPPSFVLPLRI